MSYSKQKIRERKQNRMSLESKLKKLENNITVTSTDLELKDYNSVKQELKQIYNYITEGIILRTRLSKEFYTCFFEKLADPLILALNQFFVDGECRLLKDKL